VEAYRKEVTVARLCRALGVSRSGFYAWKRRPEGVRSRERRELLGVIRRVHDEVDQLYGAPRMFRELRADGYRCGRHRVARIMRSAGLRARRRLRRRPRTTDSKHALPVAPNVLAQKFEVEAPDRVWVGDITYLRTGEGWLYLAVLLDLCSRKVVGWATDRSIDRSLAVRTLAIALDRRRPSAELLHHTDRGSQYASTDYQLELEQAKLRCSMSRKGNCYDNAVAESFFATLKKELAHHRRWHTRAEAHSDVFAYIEGFYNRRRRHSALGYLSPVDYEEAMTNA
jgi:putative transposase